MMRSTGQENQYRTAPTLYIVSLAYNEAGGIETFLMDIDKTMRSLGAPYHFVVVNDGSVDGTRQKAESLAAKMPITLLNHERNLGVGKAFDTGLRHVSKVGKEADIVITMESDRTNDPACIPAMVQNIRDGFDVVCASRYQPGGRYVGFPWMRHLYSLAANWSMRLFFPIRGVRDYTIFYRAYRVGVIAAAIRQHGDRFIEGRGFTSNAEILYKVAATQPIRCSEVPVIYRYDLKRGKSKMKVVKNIKEYGGLFLRLIRENRS